MFLMSQLPPCSRGGMVRAASLPAFSSSAPFRLPSSTPSGSAAVRRAERGSDWSRSAPLSRLFHFASSSWLGAQPIKAGMGDGGETHLRNMARARIDALAVPDRLARLGEQVGEKAAAVLGREDTRVAPLVALERSDVENIDDQDIAGLGAGDLDRADQMMTGRQVAVADVGGVVVVLDLTAGPVEGLDDEVVARLDGDDRRDIRMPAVVERLRLLRRATS